MASKKEKFTPSNKRVLETCEAHLARLERMQEEAGGSVLPSQQEAVDELRKLVQMLREQVSLWFFLSRIILPWENSSRDRALWWVDTGFGGEARTGGGFLYRSTWNTRSFPPCITELQSGGGGEGSEVQRSGQWSMGDRVAAAARSDSFGPRLKAGTGKTSRAVRKASAALSPAEEETREMSARCPLREQTPREGEH